MTTTPAERETPASKESEQAVLGAVFLSPRLLSELADARTDDFLFPSHRDILDAMRAVEAIDPITVGDEMRRRGTTGRLEGGEGYFLALTNAGSSEAMFPHHLAIVREKALARRLIQACVDTMSRAYGGAPVADLTADHRVQLAGLELDGRAGGPVSLADSIDGALDAIERRAANPNGYQVLTGIHDFDEQIGGARAGNLVVVAGRPGKGKCLGLGTEVLTFDGKKIAVEDVRAGDLLMGPDSRPRRVLSVARGRGPLFRVKPVKGQPWVCNDVHVMTTVHTITGEISDTPLDEFLRKTTTFQFRSKLFRVGVDFASSQVLPVAPYFLGLVIGDGSVRAGGVVLCKPDEEVADECRRQAGKWGLAYRLRCYGNKAPVHALVGRGGGRPNQLFVTLHDLGLEVDCASKRVPRQYLTASRPDRLELLAGLLDTDGHLECGGFDWISASSGLADDVIFLARSLGFAAHKVECRKGCQTGAVGTYYRTFISGHVDAVPTRIPRKKAAPRQQVKDVLRTGFSVEAIGEGEFAGFELDGDGRFLLADFTVTHNTSFAEGVALHNGSLNVPVLIFSLEMKRQELIERALASESGIDGRRIVSARLDLRDWQELHPAAEKLRAASVWIDDRKLTTSRICSEAQRWREMVRRARRKAGLEDDRALVAIDYLGLVRPDHRGENRNLEVAAMSAAFKGLAGDLDCPVMLLSQLNRASEKDSRKPILSDLRDSGAVEADADMVLFPWREESEKFAVPVEYEQASIIVGKNRNGPVGEVSCRFRASTMQFLNARDSRWDGERTTDDGRY